MSISGQTCRSMIKEWEEENYKIIKCEIRVLEHLVTQNKQYVVLIIMN